ARVPHPPTRDHQHTDPRSGTNPEPAVGRLHRDDHAEPPARDAEEAAGNGRGARTEDADQDALPADLLHLPGALRGDLDADDHQHRPSARLAGAMATLTLRREDG